MDNQKFVTLEDVIRDTQAGLIVSECGSEDHKAACDALKALYEAQKNAAEAQSKIGLLQIEEDKLAIERLKIQLEEARLKTEKRRGVMGFVQTLIGAGVAVGTFVAALNVDREGRFVENRNAFEQGKTNVRNFLSRK